MFQVSEIGRVHNNPGSVFLPFNETGLVHGTLSEFVFSKLIEFGRFQFFEEAYFARVFSHHISTIIVQFI